jgi:hypothetical protein
MTGRSGRLWAIVWAAGWLAAPAAAALDTPRGVYFEENRGQAPAALRYVARVQGTPLGVADDGLVLSVGGASVRLFWDGTASNAEGRDPLPGRSHYLRGTDRSQWQTDVPHFARVHESAVWPGIDVELREGGGELEYDFQVAAGADPSRIALRFAGADRVDVASDGSLEIRVRDGVLVQRPPRVFQGDREIASRYVRRDDGRFGVAFEAFDASRPLLVDPVIAYATAIGGPGSDKAFDVAVDGAGNAYVAGETESTSSFPTPGGVQTTLAGGKDAFVAKLSPTGTLLYATYLGGSGDDSAWSIALDAQGAIYVSGKTTSTNFPTRNPIQAANGGGTDAFVAKLDPTGATVVFATYLGGAADDNAEAVAVGPAGKAVLKGVTESSNFPVKNALIPSFRGVRDAFIAQLAPDGRSLEWSTYFGGTGAEDPDQTGVGVAVDSANNVVVCGTTESDDIPIAAAMQTTFAGGTRDGYVAKFTPTGGIVFSTYIGRGGGDTMRAIAVDAKNYIYLGGASRSFNFPLVNPVQKAKSVNYDAVILKLDPTGQRMLFSTYLGGNAADAVRSIAVDAKRNVYVHGQTLSTDFPQVAPLGGQHSGLVDDFVAKLGPSGSTLIYSSIVAGMANESLFPDNVGIAVDTGGRVALAGATSSFDFPFVNANDMTVEIFDAYAMRLSATPEIDLTLGGTTSSPTFSVVLRNPSGTLVDGQVKLFSRTGPGTSPVAIDLGTSPLQTVSAGSNLPIVTNRALGGAFAAGQIVTARWFDRVTGRVLAESVCEEVPCQ